MGEMSWKASWQCLLGRWSGQAAFWKGLGTLPIGCFAFIAVYGSVQPLTPAVGLSAFE